VTLLLTAGAKGKRRRKPFRIYPVTGLFSAARERRAASGGRAWSRRAATVPAVLEGVLCSSWTF